MELSQADAIVKQILEVLEPVCERIEVAGSIRRRCMFVKDIDIVLIPRNQGQLAGAIQRLGKIKLGGQKLIRVDPSRWGITIDVYIATPETWWTLLLIRTGSASHNVKLCTLAKRRGMKLHADGSGLTKDGERIAGENETSIFKALGLEYVPPNKRI